MEKEVTLQEIQQITSKILETFDLFCSKKEICYYLAYGTLLGAIRHDGFIPWDDDIDVLIPRKDYEKLLKEEYIDSDRRYRIIGSHNIDNWPYAFAKCIDTQTELLETDFNSGAIGVYIDLFPLDGLPNGRLMQKMHMKWVYFWHYMLITLQKKELKGSSKIRTIIKHIVYPLTSKIGVKKLVAIINKNGKRYPFSESKYVASQMVSVYGMRECMNAEWFADRERHKFENFDVWIPSGYDSILKSLYREYMKLPPEEKRITHHIYNVRFKD